MVISYKLRNTPLYAMDGTTVISTTQDILYKEDGVVKLAIPKDLDNRHYQEYLEWIKTNKVDPADPETLTWDDIRTKRNNILRETDWTANSDVTMSSEMTTYRQALRDITNGLTTVEQVNAVVWPEKPEA